MTKMWSRMGKVTFGIMLAVLLVWGAFGSLGLFSWMAQNYLRGSSEQERITERNLTVIYKSEPSKNK